MSGRSAVRGRFAALALLLLALGACKDSPTSPVKPDPVTPVTPPDTQQPGHLVPVGVYEFTVTGLGTGDMRATAKPVTIEQGALAPGVYASLDTIPSNQLVFEAYSVTSYTEGKRTENGFRYATIAYRVKNATAGTLTNITLIPNIASAGPATIPNTPWIALKKFDGSNADTSIARRIIPTGAMGVGPNGAFESLYPDVLQAFTEAEVAALPKPSGVTGYFPYGFMVRNKANGSSRSIPVAVDANDYGGVLTFAFRFPMTSSPNTDPFSFTFWAVAFKDSETRITESLEEANDTAAVRRLHERATALGVTTTTILAGSPAADAAVPDYPGQRQICSVRTAGTAASPTTYITSPGPFSQVALFYPGESVDACLPYFRTGSPGRPAAGVPFNVTLKAMDRYGNVETMIAEKAYIRQSDGGPPVSIGPAVTMSSGSATVTVTYTSYGNATLNGFTDRMTGLRDIAVYGVTRTWTAGAGTTNWNTGGNWAGGAVPLNSDSVYIPAAAPLMPVLTSTVQIWGVTVQDGASIALASYDLQAAGDVITGTTGGISSTTGSLYLQGTSKTVRGVVPQMVVQGTYSLSGNLTGKAPARVTGGRITNSGYLFKVTGA